MSYPISAPVTFEPIAGAELDFQAVVGQNEITNFVATTAGDMLYRKTGANNYLTRLPIGNPGDVLQPVGGVPAWTSAISNLSQGVFAVTVSGSVAGIPTSQSGGGGANPGVWFTLNNTYVTWNDITAPANDPDGCFTPATGVYAVPATGTYNFAVQVTFDSGPGVNAGNGISGFPPDGLSVRQIQIYNVTTATVLAVGITQNASSNTNQTVVVLASENVPAATSDNIVIRVRHDRSAANTVTIGATSVPFQTYFSGKRVK